MVLEKILESPLYNKEIKPVWKEINLWPLLSQLRHLLRASRGKERIVPLQKCLAMAAPNKQFVAPPMENLRKAEGYLNPGSPVTCSIGGQGKVCNGACWRGRIRDLQGPNSWEVGLETILQMLVAECWWLRCRDKREPTQLQWPYPEAPVAEGHCQSSSKMGSIEYIFLKLIYFN